MYRRLAISFKLNVMFHFKILVLHFPYAGIVLLHDHGLVGSYSPKSAIKLNQSLMTV